MAVVGHGGISGKAAKKCRARAYLSHYVRSAAIVAPSRRVKGAGRRSGESTDLSLSQVQLRRSFVVAAILALLAAVIAIAAAPGQAQAQQPAICQEYPNLPICQGPGGGGGDDDDRDTDEQQAPAGAGGGGGTGDADGKLPFTGYPITDLLLLLAILLAAGLAIRAYLAIRERRVGVPRAS